jgi:hypothetical protein
MTGTVTVRSTNSAPAVQLIQPTNGSVFSAPANISIAVSGSDSDGSVTNMTIFTSSALLASTAGNSISVTASNLAAGAFSFFAVATDNEGSKTTNQASVIVIDPSNVIISNSEAVQPNSFRFDFNVDPGLSYVIESSTSFASFFPSLTNTATSSSMSFTDNISLGGQTFYRVRRLPNP